MTDAELKRCLNDYECESLPQMLRDVAALSKHCTSEAGGRIPTWPLHEAAERLEAIAAMGDGWPSISPDLIDKLNKLATYLTEQGEYEACDLIDAVVERLGQAQDIAALNETALEAAHAAAISHVWAGPADDRARDVTRTIITAYLAAMETKP